MRQNKNQTRHSALSTMLLGVSVVASSTVWAAPPVNPKLAGEWQYAGDKKEQAQRLAAIEKVTENIGTFVRGRARSKLREQTTPSPRLTIKVNEDRIALYRENKNTELKLGGKPKKVQGPQGKVLLNAVTRGNGFAIVSKTEKGARTSVYSVSEDGTRLTVAVSMSGERLKTPLAYSTTYQRK